MMISPLNYIDNLKDKTYEELLVERDRLLDEIKSFELVKVKKFENNILYIEKE